MNFASNNRWMGRVAGFSAMVMCIAGCSKESETKPITGGTAPRKELLIYCGITMIAPMTEISGIIEEQYGCQIRITKGGSGNLLKSILHNQTGDLYLPGSERYYTVIDEEHPGLVRERVYVGQNKAVLLVHKGNPNGFTSDLKLLADPRYGVIIGDPDAGSIGKEAKVILERAGIFGEVINNAMILATDSKDILKAVKNGQADVGINWYATSTWGDNADFVDVVEIDPQLAKPKSLIIGMLEFTEYPGICRAIMELASSDEGHEIFRKHGLYFD
ncbi:MAG: substrate-binding domain-containing protein [Pontiellaceae bacterium]|nr:substrate-binding domain-containing protein [Pontiellaceae bacterium]MBN2783332.1 substrate-binding domain-containing protein [Pontiellaceae bacterium]